MHHKVDYPLGSGPVCRTRLAAPSLALLLRRAMPRPADPARLAGFRFMDARGGDDARPYGAPLPSGGMDAPGSWLRIAAAMAPCTSPYSTCSYTHAFRCISSCRTGVLHLHHEQNPPKTGFPEYPHLGLGSGRACVMAPLRWATRSPLGMPELLCSVGLGLGPGHACRMAPLR